MNRLLLVCLSSFLTVPVFAQEAYKCKTPGGGMIYQDRPCAGARYPSDSVPVSTARPTSTAPSFSPVAAPAAPTAAPAQTDLGRNKVYPAAPPHDDLSIFISKFGLPDIDKSSENEKPRPPIVTRQMIYEKEGIRAVYVPDAPIGTPPPYKSWKLMGFQDQRTNEVLKPSEVVKRLEKRKQ